jgi:hypothetical protein
MLCRRRNLAYSVLVVIGLAVGVMAFMPCIHPIRGSLFGMAAMRLWHTLAFQ